MQGEERQSQKGESIRDEIEIAEAALVSLLLSDGEGVWAKADLERELGLGEIQSADVLTNLANAGVVHLRGDLVLISRAARRMDELQL